MTYSQLIQLYFERSNALQWYWTLYVVIVGGLLAFSSIRKERDRRTTLLVTVLFCCFAYKNLGAIHDTTTQRWAVLDAIKAYPMATSSAADDLMREPFRPHIEPTLQPPLWEGVRNFHIFSSVLTVLAIWAMELRRKNLALGKMS